MKKVVLAGFLLAIANAFGAVSVTASRDYVDRQINELHQTLDGQITNKLDKSEGVLSPVYDVPLYSDWVCDPSEVRPKGSWYALYVNRVVKYTDENEVEWWAALDDRYPDDPLAKAEYDESATNLTLVTKSDIYQSEIIATRAITNVPVVVGYTLGSQTNKVLQAQGDYAVKSDLDPLFFAQYYPDGSVTNVAEFTPGIKYNDPDTTARTITVKPFSNEDGTAENDNSNLEGRVVIPPFVDAQGNPYITDDGTRYKVVGVSISGPGYVNTNLTAIVAPNTVTTIGSSAFIYCTSLASISLPAVKSIGDNAFFGCTSLTSVSLPVAESIGDGAFGLCDLLASVSLPAATNIGVSAFDTCTHLASVDFGDTPRSSVPTLVTDAFDGVPTACKIIVPYTQYDAWKAADGWRGLPQKFVRHTEKADKPVTFTTGNLAEFDNNGNPKDSGIASTNIATKTWTVAELTNSTNLVHTTGNELINGHKRFGDAATIGTTRATGTRGAGSFVQGNGCLASGDYSSAQGLATVASAPGAHAEGEGTKALNQAEHSEGKYNVSHTGSTAADRTMHSIGFGTADNARTNAVETMQDGKTYVYGLGGYNGTNPAASGVKDLATAVDDISTKLYSPDGDRWIDADGDVTEVQPVYEFVVSDAMGQYAGPYTYTNVSDTAYRIETRFIPGVWDYLVWNVDNQRWQMQNTPDPMSYVDWVSQDGETRDSDTITIYNTTDGSEEGVFHRQTGFVTNGIVDKVVFDSYLDPIIEPLLFAQYYPEGNVKSAAEFRDDIKYYLDDSARTATVKPFCNTGSNDNSSLVGRVVIPPFVDGDGKPYISDDGTRFKVVGVGNGSFNYEINNNLTGIVAPITITDIDYFAFPGCKSLNYISAPEVKSIGQCAFNDCTSLTSVALPTATNIDAIAFASCTSLVSVSLPSVMDGIGEYAFDSCTNLTSVDFGDTPRSEVPALGEYTFPVVPETCKIIVPDAQYDAWTTNPSWSNLVTRGYTFLRHSEWEYARKYEVDKKADKPATSTEGNLAEFDANGNPTDSGKSFEDIQNQIDTESPLVARSFPVQPQTGWTDGEGNSTNPIYFRPRYFGMKDGDLFKGIVMRTRSENRIAYSSGVYMRLKRYSDGQTLGVSELTVWPDKANTDVVFRFPKAIELPSSGNYYTLDFSTTPSGAAVNFGMCLYVVPSGSSNPDFYFNALTFVPVSTIQFYSWDSALSGRTYDFETNVGLYTAIRDIIQVLGGSVTNFPAIPQN